ncbi:MAG: hypothetical protein WCY41_00535 [Candidatus Micrarchaeia archaeon]
MATLETKPLEKTLPMAFKVSGNRYLVMAKSNDDGRLRVSAFIGKILDKEPPLKEGERIYWIAAGQMDDGRKDSPRKGHIFYKGVDDKEAAGVWNAIDSDRARVDWAFISRVLKPGTPITPFVELSKAGKN